MSLNYTCFLHGEELLLGDAVLFQSSCLGRANTGVTLPVSMCCTMPWSGLGGAALGHSSDEKFLE